MGRPRIQHNYWTDCDLVHFGGLGAGAISNNLGSGSVNLAYLSKKGSVALVPNYLYLTDPTADCVKREVDLL